MKIWKPAASSCELLISEKEERVRNGTSKTASVEMETVLRMIKWLNFQIFLRGQREQRLWKDNWTQWIGHWGVQFLQNDGNEIWGIDNLRELMKTAGVECFLRSVVLKIERYGTRTKEVTVRSIKFSKIEQNHAALGRKKKHLLQWESLVS